MTFVLKSYEIKPSHWARSVYHIEKLDSVVYKGTGADSHTVLHSKRVDFLSMVYFPACLILYSVMS